MFSSHRSKSALPLLLLYATHLTGCSSWRVVSVPTLEAEQETHSVEVRIATSGGGIVRLDSAMVARDSISGRVVEQSGGSDTTAAVVVAGQTGDSPHPRVSVPLNAIHTLEWRQASTGKTVLLTSGLVVGGIVVLAGAAAAVCASDESCMR
jgi:hypothetical protein